MRSHFARTILPWTTLDIYRVLSQNVVACVAILDAVVKMPPKIILAYQIDKML